ncbi:MAG: hypothetical protein ABIA62_05930 [Candidatus Woesearchaeota archaeon]
MSKTIPLYLTMIATAGCASSNYNSKFDYPDDSMKVLGVKDSTELRFLPNGYTTTQSNMSTIEDVASLYAGKTQVRTRPDGSLIIPRASASARDDASIVKVLEDMDSNGDKRVSTDEASAFKAILYTKLKQMVGRYATPEQAMKTLNISDTNELVALPGGYFTSRSNYQGLKTIAGIYSGTVELQWTGNGCSAKGTYDKNPSVLETIAGLVDANGDKIITSGETFLARRDVCDKKRPGAAVAPTQEQRPVIRQQPARPRGHTHPRHSARQQRSAEQRPSGTL